ncbi:uncharacterized protein BcabD6B2_02810 [Babesia caballi]|uniref:RAP domain-containing protein n=1 Tax=Babesia caballi TaxID=5871 RepID=A0AAV4LM16_BABCB|nr:hypothetical protein, conserved [Babesia caballi]
MRSVGRSLLRRLGRVITSPDVKRLSGLSCLELRKEIQDSARRHIRRKAIWTQYVQEVCKRIDNAPHTEGDEQPDRFTPTDISLILAAFATARKREPSFTNILLETARSEIDKYDVRDFAVLYNGLAKVGMTADDMINSFSANIESRIDAKTSEKDLALLLNALLELGVTDLNGVFIKASLVISSRIKYIANCHTLTLLLHSYSRFRGYSEVPRFMGSPPTRIPKTTQVTDENQERDVELPYKSNAASYHEAKTAHGDAEASPEETLITETKLSLLGRCADLMIHMRPTDIMYYYKAALNLIYANSSGVTRQLYASMANVHKAHIRIREHLLEFETRELVALLDTLQGAKASVDREPILDDNGSLWIVNNEIRNQVPHLAEEITSELTYRTRVMSFTECLGFLRLMAADDHRGVIVCRRLAYKVNKMNELSSWDRCSKADLWELLHCLAKRSDLATSSEAQELMVAVTKSIYGTLKLREVESMCQLATRLGAKSNSLLKKIMTVPCRADCLNPTQAASLFYHMTGLGYVDHLQPIAAACAGVDDPRDALNVLAAIAVLKVNGLLKTPEMLVENMKKRFEMGLGSLPEDKGTLNKIALLKASGLISLPHPTLAYALYPRMYSAEQHVMLRNVQLALHNKLKVDIRLMSLPQCTDEIANSLQEFLAKFDQDTRLYRDYDAGDVVLPIVVVPPGSSKVAVHVLLNDFYSGRRQMLRLDVYAQLKLIEQRGIRVVCCRAEEFVHGDRTQFVANLVERCHAASAGESQTIRQQHSKQMAPSLEVKLSVSRAKLDSFSRLRQLVSEGGRTARQPC